MDYNINHYIFTFALDEFTETPRISSPYIEPVDIGLTMGVWVLLLRYKVYSIQVVENESECPLFTGSQYQVHSL